MSKKIEHNKTLIEMQLRGIQKEKEPNEYQNEEISAHQFSERSVSIQADSVEMEDIQIQKELIDLKTNEEMQIYDLSPTK